MDKNIRNGVLCKKLDIRASAVTTMSRFTDNFSPVRWPTTGQSQQPSSSGRPSSGPSEKIRPCTVCKVRCPENQLRRFPVNKDRARLWAKRMNWEEDYDEDTRGSYRVCDDHFNDNQFFIEDGKRRLVRQALPKQKRADGYEELMPQLDRRSPCDFGRSPTPEIDFADNTAHDDEGYVLLSLSKIRILLGNCGCFKCGNKKASRSMRKKGTTAIAAFNCNECGKYDWSTTEKVSEESSISVYKGNLDLSASVSLSGIPWQRFEDFAQTMELFIPSKATHYKIQRALVVPSIDKFHYDHETSFIYDVELHSNKSANVTKLVLVGDGQYDSRGRSAQFCRYTIMDHTTRLILGVAVVEKTETQNVSYRMEAHGCVKAIEELLEKQTKTCKFEIVEFVTDAHKDTTDKIAAVFPDMRHRTDKWHAIKNMQNKFRPKLKAQRYKDVLKRIWKKFLHHCWKSIETAGNNKKMALELIQSSVYHMMDQHTFPGKFETIDRCPHGDKKCESIIDKKNKNEVKFLELIKHIVHFQPFVDAIMSCSAEYSTTAIELFHSVVAKIYCQKNIFFNKNGMEWRTKLAILHHNFHRQQILEEEEKATSPMLKRAKVAKSHDLDRTYVRKNVAPNLRWKCDLLAYVNKLYMEKKLKGEEVFPRAARAEEEENEASDDAEDDDVLYMLAKDLENEDHDDEEENGDDDEDDD